MAAFLRLPLASISSVRIGKTCSDQPRMTVCSFSTTRERPLRSSSICASRPALSTPINVDITKMPISVTNNVTMRKGQLVSPAMLPASKVCISEPQAASMNDIPSSPVLLKPERARTAANRAMAPRVTIANHAISAMVPLASVLSKA